MTRMNRFSSFLDRFEEQLDVSTFKLKHEFNEWIDERVGLVRAEVRQLKAQFTARNHHTAQVHSNDDEPRVETVELEQFLEEQRRQQHELATATASTSTGRKRSSRSQSPSTSSKKPRTNPPNNYSCKFHGCGKSFPREFNLVMHEHIHLGIKPYSCTWLNCAYSSEQRGHVVLYVRTKHFKLPSSQKEQRRLNIIDQRDPNVYVNVDADLANRRL